MIIRKFVIAIASKFDPRGFRQAERAAQKLNKSIATQGRAHTSTGRSAEASQKKTRQSIKKTEREFLRAVAAQERAIEKQRRAQQRATNARVRQAEKAARAEIRATEKAARARKRAADKALREEKRRIDQINRERARAARRAEAERRRRPGALQAAGAGALGALGAVAGVGAAIGAVAAPILETGMRFESLRAQLDNLLGGAEAGQRAFDQIREFATTTPFQLTEVTSSFIKLEAQGLKPTRERLTAFGDLAAATGKSLDQVTEAALDAARGEGERLKELGIVMRSVGDQVQLSFRGQTLEVEKNDQAITEALVKFGQFEGVAGSMAAQMNTLRGQVSNAKDALEGFLNTAAQSGPLERTGQILERIRELFLSTENAEMLGQALDEIFKIIQDALEDTDPETITNGFKLLLNLIKLIGIALRPFIALWKAAVGLLDTAAASTESLVELFRIVENVITGVTSLGDALNQAKDAMVGFWTESEKTGAVLDALGDRATNALDKVRAAATGAIFESATDEQLQAIVASETATGDQRQGATRELQRRRGRAGRASAREAERQSANRRRAQLLQEDASAARRGRGGPAFFDFEQRASQAARQQAEKFAERELRRLRQEGVAPSQAIEQARSAGRQRARELKAAFLEAGRIFDGATDNILDALGLRGPGSILEGRPPPQTLIITISPVITFIGEFLQQNTFGAGAGVTEAAAEGGRAAVEAGLGPARAAFEELVNDIFDLRTSRLLQADGGGVQPLGPGG